MRTRQLLRAALDTRWTQASQLPPTYLIPSWRAQLHQAAQPTQFQQTPPEVPPHSSISPSSSIPSTKPQNPFTETTSPSQSIESSTSSKPLVLSQSVQQLLPVLHAQRPHYITAHIHRFPYLLTAGDTLRLPFHMPDVSVGDVLRLNKASVLGSREYTLKAGLSGLPPNALPSMKGTGDGSNESPYLDERLFVCRARVVGVDSSPLMIKEKKKRRQRRTKTVRSKHKYTILKIMDVKVNSLDELMHAAEGGAVVLE